MKKSILIFWCMSHLSSNRLGIAFAVHLLLGEKLEEVEFDQSQMRQHLLICFKERRFSAFPTKWKSGSRSRHFPYREIELYCTCLMPETYRDSMIECEGCELWFHTNCVGVSCVPQHWYCNSFQWLIIISLLLIKLSLNIGTVILVSDSLLLLIKFSTCQN